MGHFQAEFKHNAALEADAIEEFWQLPRVASAWQFAVAGYFTIFVLTLSVMMTVFMLLRQRFLIEQQNITLTKKVDQRTIELENQAQMLEKHKRVLGQSEARLQAILNNAADSIIIINQQGDVEIFNKAAEQLFGYLAGEIIGRSVNRFIPTLIIPDIHIYLDRFSDLAQSTASIRPFQKLMGCSQRGEMFPIELHLSEETMGEAFVYTAIVRDIRDRKAAEIEIQRAKDHAELFCQAKSEFLTNMSHELRTPLNAIIGYCELLYDELADEENEQYIADLNHIHDAGKHLLHLINEILDLSKIEAGKMELHLENFVINDVLDDVLTELHQTLEKNQNTLRLECAKTLAPLNADLKKIRQIIVNLLSNANKFTQNGIITVTVSSIKKHEIDWLSLIITDTGIGMSKADRDELFQEFRQGDSSTTKRYGGAGLGLTITRYFCEMMGGTIGVESELGDGTKVTVHLPMSIIGPRVDPVKVRLGDSVPLGGMLRTKVSRILVIGDNAFSRDLIERFLTREGFFADVATNINQALTIVAQHRPDAIVLDENSLSHDGWKCMNQIKNDKNLVDIPIIMLTKSDSKTLAQAIGATDFIAKPIQRNRLIDIVVKYIRQPSRPEVPNAYVLVIDDDEVNRRMLQRILEGEGLKVDVAENGLVGLNKVAKRVPLLIFLDIVMPVMDGFRFVEELRKNVAWRSVPIITLTGFDLTSDQRARLNGQVETILSKGAVGPAGILKKMRDIVVNCVRSA